MLVGLRFPGRCAMERHQYWLTFQTLEMGLASDFTEEPEAGYGSLRESVSEPRKGHKDRFQRGDGLSFFKMESALGFGKADSGRNSVPGPRVTKSDQDRVCTETEGGRGVAEASWSEQCHYTAGLRAEQRFGQGASHGVCLEGRDASGAKSGARSPRPEAELPRSENGVVGRRLNGGPAPPADEQRDHPIMLSLHLFGPDL